jgi:hypothetical protein
MVAKSLRFLAVTVATVCVSLLVVELALHLLRPDTVRGNIILRLTHERLTWPTPDAAFHHVGEGIHHLNFPDHPDGSLQRVMIVGDSFAAGHGVAEEESWARRLQRHLKPSVKLDVLATEGYSPVIYSNVVRRAFTSAAYRAVIVLLDQTDPADELVYAGDVIESGSTHSFDVDRMRDRQKVVDRAYADFLARFSDPISWRSLTLVNLLAPRSLLDEIDPASKHYRYASLSLARPALIGEFNENPLSASSRQMASLLSKYLDEIVSQCRERDVPVFLAASVWEFQSSPRPRVTLRLPGPFPKENRLEQFLEDGYGHRPGAYVVPLTRAFKEHPDPSSLYISFPGHEFHWNAAGHALAETVLRKAMLDALPELAPGSE